MRVLLALPLLLAACSSFSSGETADAGPAAPDARVSAVEDGATPVDAGRPEDAAPETSVDLPSGDRRGLVFVTAEPVPGALGADSPLAAADAVCRKSAASMVPARSWVAWLSLKGTRAVDRLPAGMSWHLTDRLGRLAFASKDELARGPRVPIAFDALGRELPATGALVWTGTKASFATGNNCGDWSFSTGFTAVAGLTSVASALWTEAQEASCDAELRLYCFET